MSCNGSSCGANGVAQPRAPRSSTPSTTGRASTAAYCKQSHADPKGAAAPPPAYTAALSVHRQQHLLVPAPSEVARAAASALLKIEKQALHTSYTSKAWPKFLLADAAVSTPVFAPPVMPVHDTRLRFGRCHALPNRNAYLYVFYTGLPERSSIRGEDDTSPWGLRNDSFASTSRQTG